jgi:hypothetical protein
MTVTVDYQVWDSTSYNWLDKTTSTSAPLQINDKLDAWVAAVNANASNTSKQITVRKDPADSTSANFIGWVIEAASGSANSGFFTRFYTSAATNIVCTFSAAWTNDGTNGGYGAASGNSAADTSTTWVSSGAIGEFSVAAETANGQEFFCLGWRQNNSTVTSDQLLIFKDSSGEWASLFSDGGTVIGSFYMPVHTAPQRNYNITLPWLNANSSTFWLSGLVLSNSSATNAPAAENEFTATICSASPALYMAGGTGDYGYGRWSNVTGGKKVVCMGYGPIYVVF